MSQTALVVQPAATASTALEPTTIDQAFWLANQLVKSGLLGRSIQKPEAAFAVILAGRELGLTAMQSLRSLHVIEGKPTMSADLMVALVKRSPTCKSFRLFESSTTIATYETERVNEGVTRMSFTMDEAKTAGITGKDNWRKYPAAMLRARCIAALARVVYPDLLLGIYEQDEIAPAVSSVSAVSNKPVEVLPIARAANNETVDVQFEEDRPVEMTSRVPDDDGVTEISLAEWSAKFMAAHDLDELESLRALCKEMVKDESILLQIGTSYTARKRELKS